MEKVIEMIPEVTKAEWQLNVDLTDEYIRALPALPSSWVGPLALPPKRHLHGLRYFQKGTRDALRVIADCSVFWDHSRWIHVSCSRKGRMPTYEDLVEVKALFIGPDRQAIQCFPKKEKHVNIHPFCLHLWCCLDGDGLPDFGRHGTI